MTVARSTDRTASVRQAYAHFAATRRLSPGRYTDDFVWDMSTFRGWPERQEYWGHAGAQEFIETWVGSWDDWRLEVRDVVDSGGDEVVAIVHQEGRAKGSGVHVAMDMAQVWTFRDGKFARQRMYSDIDEALASVGVQRLPEPR